jgi:hypothetical protein
MHLVAQPRTRVTLLSAAIAARASVTAGREKGPRSSSSLLLLWRRLPLMLAV